MSGSGKTTLLLRLMTESKARWKWTFDPARETSRKLGWTVATDLAGLEAATAAGRPVCFDPHDAGFSSHREAFAFFCRWTLCAAAQLRGPKLFCCDEIDAVTRTGTAGITQATQDALDRGRREEIDMLLCAQRLNEVHDGIRGSLTDIFTFRQDDDLPLAWLERRGIPREIVQGLAYTGGFHHKSILCPNSKKQLSKPAKPEKQSTSNLTAKS